MAPSGPVQLSSEDISLLPLSSPPAFLNVEDSRSRKDLNLVCGFVPSRNSKGIIPSLTESNEISIPSWDVVQVLLDTESESPEEWVIVITISFIS